MKLYENMVKSVSIFFDKIAQVILCALILLVVVNIMLRIFFSKPILGTYEYVGFLASLIIGLSLAYCAFEDGNIAVEYFLQKVSPTLQALAESIAGLIAFIFFIFAAWHMNKFAYSMASRGEVAASTGTPMFYFVYIVMFGILMLCLVILAKTINAARQVFHK